jgi:hypothetical protein
MHYNLTQTPSNSRWGRKKNKEETAILYEITLPKVMRGNNKTVTLTDEQK